MGKSEHLERRGAVYYCRMRCPQHLMRPGIPEQKWLSLRTKERSVALERLPDARVKIMAFFRGEAEPPSSRSGIFSATPVRRRPSHPDIPILLSGEVEAVAKQFFNARFADLDIATAEIMEMEPQAVERWGLELGHHLASLDHVGPHDEDPAADMEADLLTSIGRRSAYSSEPSRLLRSYIRRALKQLYAIELARMQGDFRDVVTDRLFQTSAESVGPPSSTPVGKSVLLKNILEQFRASELDANEDITAKTREKSRAALEIVERFFGPDRELATISGTDCRAFRNLVSRLPPNLKKRFDGNQSLDEIADATEKSGGSTMSRATQTSYLRSLNRVLEFAKADGAIATNPFSAKLKPRGKARGRQNDRNAYSDIQLKKIFSSPVYTGCVDDERGFAKPLSGNVIRRSRFWLPLIALFSGLRMGEILQLTKWHVQTAPDQLPCFMIGADMKLKTLASYRVVPIHRELIRLGFVSFARGKKSADELLFDDVGRGSDGYRSSVFSKRYAIFAKSLAMDEPGRTVSFHSFRHNFRDALRQPDINSDLIKEVGGWSRGKETAQSYGDGARAVVLRPIIDRVEYPLDLSSLYVTPPCNDG